MSNEPETLVEEAEDQSGVDPWEAAFAALATKTDPKPDSSEGEQDPEDAGGDEPIEPGADEPSEDGAGDATGGSPEPGGVDVGGLDIPDEDLGNPLTTDADIEEAISGYQSQARDAAIESVLEEFKKRGAYVQPNGKLGRSVNDPDIAKKDSSGRVRYYNPETGEEFRGPNPRRDAREYVDDYNKELAEGFNQVCARKEAELMKEYTPAINTLKFANTYEKLDPLRKGLLDDVIEDYEVRDKNGDLIGYSCDLNAALNLVNRQVKRMQSMKAAEPKPPTGPALDMKKGSNKGKSEPDEKPEIKSLEDAMVYLQNKKLKGRK